LWIILEVSEDLTPNSWTEINNVAPADIVRHPDGSATYTLLAQPNGNAPVLFFRHRFELL